MANQEDIYVALNMVPVPLENYNIGVTESGRYKILMNTDDMKYGGSGYPDGSDASGAFKAKEEAWNGKPYHISVNLPPLGGIYFQKVKTTAKATEKKASSKTAAKAPAKKAATKPAAKKAAPKAEAKPKKTTTKKSKK